MKDFNYDFMSKNSVKSSSGGSSCLGLLLIVLVAAVLFLGFSWLTFMGFTWAVTTLFGASIAWTWWNWLAWVVGSMCVSAGSFASAFNSKKS